MTTILKIALLTTVGYVFYILFLRNMKMYRAQRLYILACCVLAVVLPFALDYLSGLKASSTVYLPSITIHANGIRNNQLYNELNINWLQTVYITGLGIMVLYYLLAIIKIARLTKGTAFRDIQKHIFYVSKPVAPFSFINRIYLPAKLKDSDERHAIIQHEQAHIDHFHSADILFFTIFALVQWFNPFAWLLLRNLKEVHEYQADETTIKSGVSIDLYCQQIVSQTLGCQVQVLVNNFNKSLTLKRLAMLTKEKVSKWGKVKFAFLVPAVMLAFSCLLLIQCEQKESNSNISELAPPPPPPPPAEEIAPPPPPPPPPITENKGLDGNPVYIIVDKTASLQGGDINDFRNYIQKNISYPEKAIAEKIEGKVIAQFVVNANGQVESVEILRGLSIEINKEVVRAILASPKWTPAEVKNTAVNQSFVIPVVFKL